MRRRQELSRKRALQAACNQPSLACPRDPTAIPTSQLLECLLWMVLASYGQLRGMEERDTEDTAISKQNKATQIKSRPGLLGCSELMDLLITSVLQGFSVFCEVKTLLWLLSLKAVRARAGELSELRACLDRDQPWQALYFSSAPLPSTEVQNSQNYLLPPIPAFSHLWDAPSSPVWIFVVSAEVHQP
ncbi:uncharacterized protein [Aphelocoma coerulescens]|uniref:uncharacterized protein isoform X2 n=1 Tax=Aphelocoma coerulescens TaxID=39617 RepID=UPI0036051A04